MAVWRPANQMRALTIVRRAAARRQRFAVRYEAAYHLSQVAADLEAPAQRHALDILSRLTKDRSFRIRDQVAEAICSSTKDLHFDNQPVGIALVARIAQDKNAEVREHFTATFIERIPALNPENQPAAIAIVAHAIRVGNADTCNRVGLKFIETIPKLSPEAQLDAVGIMMQMATHEDRAPRRLVADEFLHLIPHLEPAAQMAGLDVAFRLLAPQNRRYRGMEGKVATLLQVLSPLGGGADKTMPDDGSAGFYLLAPEVQARLPQFADRLMKTRDEAVHRFVSKYYLTDIVRLLPDQLQPHGRTVALGLLTSADRQARKTGEAYIERFKVPAQPLRPTQYLRTGVAQKPAVND